MITFNVHKYINQFNSYISSSISITVAYLNFSIAIHSYFPSYCVNVKEMTRTTVLNGHKYNSSSFARNSTSCIQVVCEYFENCFGSFNELDNQSERTLQSMCEHSPVGLLNRHWNAFWVKLCTVMRLLILYHSICRFLFVLYRMTHVCCPVLAPCESLFFPKQKKKTPLKEISDCRQDERQLHKAADCNSAREVCRLFWKLKETLECVRSQGSYFEAK